MHATLTFSLPYWCHPATMAARRRTTHNVAWGLDDAHTSNLRRHQSLDTDRPIMQYSRRMSIAGGRRSLTLARSQRRMSARRAGVPEPANTPLYLYRAPTHQMRIGLRTDRLAPGEEVEGTVVLYRDNAAGERVADIVDVQVTLHCEVARRKENLSYCAGQQFRPQDISPHTMKRYAYTRTLVPHSQSWQTGPLEARYHHDATPFFPVVYADMLPQSGDNRSNHGRVQCHSFSVRVPSDAPPSRTWNDDKPSAFVDLRYRVVAEARLAHPDGVLMAEAVFIVAPHRSAVPKQSLYGVPGVTARGKTPFSRRALTLTVEQRSVDVGSATTASVQLRMPKHLRPKVYLAERVLYNGRLRTERRVSCATQDDTQWRVDTRGMCEDIVLGPLTVTHEVLAMAGELCATARIRLCPGYSGDEEVRAATRKLRRQPPIYYYFEDELPLFGNLEYRAARSGGAANPTLCAAALAARLPRLTHAISAPGEDVCCLCLDELDKGMVTRLNPCGHIMHLECAQRWLRHAARERRPNVCCPMCKQLLQ